jgi:Fic family protein
MANLEQFINNDELCNIDPLIKMTVIHHQFESIHPFYDGNGRTGRIINILYLVRCGLLDSPILYLSRYINQRKADYYRLLQAVRTENAWEAFTIYMLEGVEQTSRQTTYLIRNIKNLMHKHKNKIRTELPKIYSQDLLNNLFKHPYTKTEFLSEELDIERRTAAKYLDNLVDIGLLAKHKIQKRNFYLNIDLFELLRNVNTKTDFTEM